MELLLPLILLVPLLLITFRARKQQRQFAELQASLVPGQAVMTTAGLHGTIHEIDGDVVVLDVADGVQLRWARTAIGQVLKPAPQAADDQGELRSGRQAGSTDAGRSAGGAAPAGPDGAQQQDGRREA